MMFALLLISELCGSGYYSILVSWFFMFSNENLSVYRFNRMNSIAYWLYTLDSIAEYTAHSIFVIKYWVLASKITRVVMVQPDPYLAIKSNLMFYGQISLIVISFMGYTIFRLYLNPTWQLNFMLALQSLSLFLILAI